MSIDSVEFLMAMSAIRNELERIAIVLEMMERRQ